jgi:hypothetical protein
MLSYAVKLITEGGLSIPEVEKIQQDMAQPSAFYMGTT